MAVRRMGVVEWGLLAALAAVWGGSFFFVEVLIASLDWPTVVVLRIAPAALALTLLVHVMGHRLPADWPTWRAFLVMGAINNVAPFSLIAWGQLAIDSGLAAILNATTPLFTVLLAHVLTRDERMTSNRLIGVLLGLGGVAVLVGPDILHELGAQGLAQLAVLGAAASYACAGIYGRRFKELPPAIAAAGMLCGTTVMILPVALILDQPWSLRPSVVTWGAVLGLSLFSTALAYLIYFRILAAAGATNLLLVTFLIPVSALFLGVAVLGERPDWSAFAGLALIFAGLAAVDGRLFSVVRRRD